MDGDEDEDEDEDERRTRARTTRMLRMLKKVGGTGKARKVGTVSKVGMLRMLRMRRRRSAQREEKGLDCWRLLIVRRCRSLTDAGGRCCWRWWGGGWSRRATGGQATDLPHNHYLWYTILCV